jgi:DMSO/TMAO reductase YedYZ molybdopterin-dependent catalytic subunit
LKGCYNTVFTIDAIDFLMFHNLYHQKQHVQQLGHLSDKLLDLPASFFDGFEPNPFPGWSLSVEGLVQTPRQYMENQLKSLPHITQNRRLVSADGWTYRTEWMGIPLQHLVEAVRPTMQATHLRQENLTGDVSFLPLTELLRSRPLLCVGVGNQPLPPVYGGPIRLLVFDRYSYKGLGQLSKLTFVSQQEAEQEMQQETWVQRGYTAEGTIVPGRYYAFDLKRFRPVPHPGEVTIY